MGKGGWWWRLTLWSSSLRSSLGVDGVFHPGIQLAYALRADAVAEIGLRVAADVRFQLMPVSLVVANLFAGRADGQQSAELLHLGQGGPKLPDQLLALGLVAD